MLATLAVVVFASLAIPSSSQALKLAVIDMASVYKNFSEVSKSQAYLKEKKDEYQHLIDKEKYSLREEELQLESLKEDLRTNRDKYSEEEMKVKQADQRRLVQSWQKKFQTMKDKFEGYKTQLEEMERKEFATIKEKIDRCVSTVARRLGIDLVLERQWVYFASNKVDITDHVLKELQGK
jgi:outer membrane protein